MPTENRVRVAHLHEEFVGEKQKTGLKTNTQLSKQ